MTAPVQIPNTIKITINTTSPQMIKTFLPAHARIGIAINPAEIFAKLIKKVKTRDSKTDPPISLKIEVEYNTIMLIPDNC